MASESWWSGADEIEIPIFPLPATVHFPGAFLPLHVFEPRYRALVQDALRGDGRFAVALLKPGYEQGYYEAPEVHPITCVGRISAHERLPDGRFFLVLEGLGRVELLRQERGAPYRLYRARCLPEELPDDRGLLSIEARALVGSVHQVVQRVLQRRSAPIPEGDEVAEKLSSISKQVGGMVNEPGRLADFVASCFVPEPEIRQSLLETFEVRERLRQVTGLLGDAILRMEGSAPRGSGVN